MFDLFFHKFSQSYWKLAIIIIATIITSCKSKSNDILYGYIESEPLFIYAPTSGYIDYLAISRGSAVARGELLVSLENESESASTQQASALVEQSLGQEEDLSASSKRGAEIKGLQAAVNVAEAAFIKTKKDLQRQNELVNDGFVSTATLDAYIAQRDTAKENLNLAKAQLETGNLAARNGQRKSAKAATEANKAQLRQREWALRQKKIISPADGHVRDTYYQAGEYVTVGSPILSLEKKNSLKIKFFVAEHYRSQMHIGRNIKYSHTGSDIQFSAKIVYLAKDSEFTPPAIYSREMRSRLVWLVEATPNTETENELLSPGQIVDIVINKNQ